MAIGKYMALVGNSDHVSPVDARKKDERTHHRRADKSALGPRSKDILQRVAFKDVDVLTAPRAGLGCIGDCRASSWPTEEVRVLSRWEIWMIWFGARLPEIESLAMPEGRPLRLYDELDVANGSLNSGCEQEPID